MRVVIIAALVAIVAFAAIKFLTDYSSIDSLTEAPKSASPSEFRQTVENIVDKEVETEIVEFATGLQVPWSMIFTSNERMLVTQRPGQIVEIVNGQLRPEPLIKIDEIVSTSEEGLMGMEIDPNYSSNKNLYTCYAYREGSNTYNKVVKLIDEGNQITIQDTLVDQIPSASFHAGCALQFGPDGKLYVTTGDASERNLAQNLQSLAGKILRMNTDGSIPSDNPFDNSLIYSYGHRNPQGMDFHPGSGVMFASEHGPSGFDGPRGGDEINIVRAGENYGWPVVSHERSNPQMIDPVVVFTPAFAPASGVFYSSDIIPQFRNKFFVGGLVGEGIVVVTPNDTGDGVLNWERLEGIDYGRIRAIAQGPDGHLYFATSNRDGRGDIRDGEDKIYMIRPKGE